MYNPFIQLLTAFKWIFYINYRQEKGNAQEVNMENLDISILDILNIDLEVLDPLDVDVNVLDDIVLISQ